MRGPAPSGRAGWSSCRRRAGPGRSRPSTTAVRPSSARTRVARRRRCASTLVTPATGVGKSGVPAAAPASPSWPTLSPPQQSTPPLTSTAHEKSLARSEDLTRAGRVIQRGRDRDHDAGDLLGQATLRVAAVAELARVVGAPAEHGTEGRRGAGVAVAGGDRDDVVDGGDADGEGARRARPVAELTSIVAAPAPQGAVRPHEAGVTAARGDGRDLFAPHASATHASASSPAW